MKKKKNSLHHVSKTIINIKVLDQQNKKLSYFSLFVFLFFLFFVFLLFFKYYLSSCFFSIHYRSIFLYYWSCYIFPFLLIFCSLLLYLLCFIFLFYLISRLIFPIFFFSYSFARHSLILYTISAYPPYAMILIFYFFFCLFFFLPLLSIAFLWSNGSFYQFFLCLFY